ncbi:hypothetical protein L596_026451 [Steinernema carpocapsae]|uniref:F-box domain-containing protein n=1 Tax=Steinernema carpocapsae TaxID=34508 RepID=A0A4U5M2E4_STECR|nr:hypothetical protein L596_026451 [Steinernema carpocapsae]
MWSPDILSDILSHSDIDSAYQFRQINQKCRNVADYVMFKKKLISLNIYVGPTPEEDNFVLSVDRGQRSELLNKLLETFQFTAENISTWPQFLSVNISIKRFENFLQKRTTEITKIFETDIGDQLNSVELELHEYEGNKMHDRALTKILKNLKDSLLTEFKVIWVPNDPNNVDPDGTSTVSDILWNRAGCFTKIVLLGPYTLPSLLKHIHLNPLTSVSTLTTMVRVPTKDTAVAFLSLIDSLRNKPRKMVLNLELMQSAGGSAECQDVLKCLFNILIIYKGVKFEELQTTSRGLSTTVSIPTKNPMLEIEFNHTSVFLESRIRVNCVTKFYHEVMELF